MKEVFFVSIIIPTYNNKDSLKKTVISLCEQSYPKDKYEIIVVDDGSTDDLGKDFISWQRVCSCQLRYFFQKNKGPAAARNLGIRYAVGDIIAFIDSDCIATNTWLEEIVKGYNNEKIAGIGGTIKALPTASKISQYCAYIKMNERPVIDKTGIVYLITGNASFKKDCLNLIGGFDERYDFPGGEDPDICYRMRKYGYIFQYNKNAVVYNKHKERLRDLLKTYFNYGKGESFLALRKFSYWELKSVTGFKWLIYFIKTIGYMALAFMNNIKLIIRFLKIPFKALSYYGQGLSIRDSVLYASLDYAKDFSFMQGCYFGYFIGKFKGFRKNDDLLYLK